MRYQLEINTDIKPLLCLSREEAQQKNVQITEIEITKQFYYILSNYLEENKLFTWSRYGKGGENDNGDILLYTCYFRLKQHRKSYKPRFYISNHSSTANVSDGFPYALAEVFDTSKKLSPPQSSEKLNYCKEKTPTLFDLFYDMVDEYQNDILNVTWYYDPTTPPIKLRSL